MDTFSRQIEFLEQHSNYARRWLHAQPLWRQWLCEHGSKKIDLRQIQALLDSYKSDDANTVWDEAQFMCYLRLARQQLMLWIAFRDLNGLAQLDEVTHSLSDFAQLAVAQSITFIRNDLQPRFGVPWSEVTNSEMPLMVVGMVSWEVLS